jgi:hypothetical protein
MGLLKKCQPCMWEGATRIDLLETFAPWAKELCTGALALEGVACKFSLADGCSVELAPISEEHPLDTTTHYVACCEIPMSAVAVDPLGFEAFYASIGVAVIGTVCDGDCGLMS